METNFDINDLFSVSIQKGYITTSEYIVLNKMINNATTEEERKAVDSIDMTPILGTPAERLRMAMDKAIEYMRKWKLAESSQKMAWSEQRQQAEIASNAFSVLREIRKDNGLSEDSKDMIDKFLGPWS